uniref:Uncharacterized protein n=1 Tax=Oryza rufipogon TaxID=4529 RepID=A0A0E0QMX4_ORYRU
MAHAGACRWTTRRSASHHAGATLGGNGGQAYDAVAVILRQPLMRDVVGGGDGVVGTGGRDGVLMVATAVRARTVG